MKKYINIFSIIILLLTTTVSMTSCELEDIVDPNAVSVDFVQSNLSEQGIIELSVGVLEQARRGYDTYLTSLGSIGRECYRFDADPRNTADLLGKEGVQLDNNSFYLTAPYNNFYRTIKNANLLLEAIDNTVSIGDTLKEGCRGFAKTMQAYKYLLLLNVLHDNGIRIDVADPDNLGPFVDRASSYTQIRALLDDAITNLNAAGSGFLFPLPGFEGFDTPSTFIQFNRAIAMRVAIYQENWAEVLNLTSGAFLNESGDLSIGPKYVFSTGSGDLTNGLFFPANNASQILVQPNNLTDAASGDTRVTSKFRERTDAITQDGLTATHEIGFLADNSAPLFIIRNEELLLMKAEAEIRTGAFPNAVATLNIIRNAAGLANYSGTQDEAALTDELLTQRRYSLWMEGHRMIDLRRYGRLNATFVPIDRTGDIVHSQFPIPLNDIP